MGILLITIAALVFAAVPAQAAKLRSVSSSVTAVGGGPGVHGATVTAVARCPKGTKALSGGYTTSTPQQEPLHYLTVSESVMTSRGDGWRVSGSEQAGAPATDTLTAHVTCEKRRRALLLGGTIRTDQIPSITGQSTSNSAECPEGTRVVSGGFRTHSTGAYFYASMGAGRDWGVGVTNIDGPAQDLYDVEAYCVQAKVKRVSVTQSVAGIGSVASARATPCPKGTMLVGGGFAADQPAGGLEKGALVFNSGLAGTAWSVSAEDVSNALVGFSAVGYCRAG
jgi:hypothetical protein